MPRLTARQERFIELFATGTVSATEAAVRAGFASSSARTHAQELLGKPHVKAALAARKGEIRQWVDMGDAELIGRIATIARDDAERTGVRLRALELLSKITGLSDSVQRVEHSYAHDMERLNREIAEAATTH